MAEGCDVEKEEGRIRREGKSEARYSRR